METINDLGDLLIHYLLELYAAEEQVLVVMPGIIQKAQHRSLKNALQHHMDLTAEQQKRIEKIVRLMNEARENNDAKQPVSLPGNTVNSTAAKGIAGLIEEAQMLLSATLSKEVTDPAIIACVQKIEHYEICTYGTAHAFALQLQLKAVETLLLETLEEEYAADDLLTALATSAFNKESAGETEGNPRIDHQEDEDAETGRSSGKISIDERTINSPGGRAGTSHRRYPSGESRGH